MKLSITLSILLLVTYVTGAPKPLHDEIGWSSVQSADGSWAVETRGYFSHGHTLRILFVDCKPNFELLTLSTIMLRKMKQIPNVFEKKIKLEVQADDWETININAHIYEPKNLSRLLGLGKDGDTDLVQISGKNFLGIKNGEIGEVVRIAFPKDSIYYKLFDIPEEYFSMENFEEVYENTLSRCKKTKEK